MYRFIIRPFGNQNCFWRAEDVFVGSCVNAIDPNRKLVIYTNGEDFIHMIVHLVEYTLFPRAVMAHPISGQLEFLQIRNLLSPYHDVSLDELKKIFDEKKNTVEQMK